MSITITLSAVLSDAADGTKNHQTEGQTVGGALRALSDTHAGLVPLFWKNTGKFNPMLVVFCNDEDVRNLKNMETTLKPGDRLDVITAVEGG